MRTLTLILFLTLISPALAGSVTVENNVSVEANSGGNSLRRSSGQAGQTIVGTSSAEIKVKTVINGEVITDEKFHKESTGTPVKIEKKIINKATSTIDNHVEENKRNKYFKNFFWRIFRRFKFW